MITGIGAFKGINIKGIGNFKGISINNGGHSIGEHRVSIIKKFGGKYRQVPYINRYIKEIAEENRCHTFIELTGGGGRTILNLPIFEMDGEIYKFGRCKCQPQIVHLGVRTKIWTLNLCNKTKFLSILIRAQSTQSFFNSLFIIPFYVSI